MRGSLSRITPQKNMNIFEYILGIAYITLIGAYVYYLLNIPKRLRSIKRIYDEIRAEIS